MADSIYKIGGTVYESLEDAFSAVDDNGTIEIIDGEGETFSEPFVVNKSVTIKACADGIRFCASAGFNGDALFKVCNGVNFTLENLYVDATAANVGKMITCPTGETVPYGGTRCVSLEGSCYFYARYCTINVRECSLNGAVVNASDCKGEINFEGVAFNLSDLRGSGGIVAIEGHSDVKVNFSYGLEINFETAQDDVLVQGNGGLIAAFGDSKVNVYFDEFLAEYVFRSGHMRVAGNGGLVYFGPNVSGTIEIGWGAIYDFGWYGYVNTLMSNKSYDPRTADWRTAWNNTVHQNQTGGPTRFFQVDGVGDVVFYWDDSKVQVINEGMPFDPMDNAQWNFACRNVSSADLALMRDFASRQQTDSEVVTLSVPFDDPVVIGQNGLYREIDAAITDNNMLTQHVNLECPSRSAIALAYLYGENEPSPVNKVILNVADSSYEKGLSLNGFYKLSSVDNPSGGKTVTFVRYKKCKIRELVSTDDYEFTIDTRTERTVVAGSTESFTIPDEAWKAAGGNPVTVTYTKDGGAAQTLGTYKQGDKVEWTPIYGGTYVFTFGSSEYQASFHVDKTPGIFITSAKQRWPWNGMVDIGYFVEGLDSEKEYTATFHVTCKGETKSFTLAGIVNGDATTAWDAAAATAWGKTLVKEPATVSADLRCLTVKVPEP